MQRRYRTRAACLAAAMLVLAAEAQASALPAQTASLAPVLREVLPAVVSIIVFKSAGQNPLASDPSFRHFFPPPPSGQHRDVIDQAEGSGIVVNAERGRVLTNAHLVDGAQRIIVTLRDSRHFEAKVVGRDRDTDLALLKIAAPELVAMPFGDSDAVEVGDFVVAIGNSFGLGQTVTSGIVSAIGRSGLGIEGYEDFIQTDAAINPGNSGGALIDLKGDLIGIDTAIVAPAQGSVGIGFAIPVNMARVVMDQLEQYGDMRRGQLGITVKDRADRSALNSAASAGAVISKVTPGSPAAAAGLKPDDIIVKFDDVPVRDAQQFRNRIGLTRVGQQVELEIDRNGQTRKMVATIGPRAKS